MSAYYVVKAEFWVSTGKYTSEATTYWLSKNGVWNSCHENAKRFGEFEAEYSMALASGIPQPGEIKSLSFLRTED